MKYLVPLLLASCAATAGQDQDPHDGHHHITIPVLGDVEASDHLAIMAISGLLIAITLFLWISSKFGYRKWVSKLTGKD